MINKYKPTPLRLLAPARQKYGPGRLVGPGTGRKASALAAPRGANAPAGFAGPRAGGAFEKYRLPKAGQGLASRCGAPETGTGSGGWAGLKINFC